MAAFRTGAAEAEAASAKSSFAKTDFLSIADGKHVNVRFLTDHNQFITVAQHNNVPTRHAPDGYTGTWPQSMSGICRVDAHNGIRTFPEHADCYICNLYAQNGEKTYKPNPRGWALAVLREQKMVDGRAVGMQDEMVEVEVDGVKSMIPKIVVANFSWNNFWGGLSALSQMHGTWLDRDIRILRKGTGLDTDYTFAAYDPVTVEGGPVGTGQERMDLRNPAHMARYSAHAPDLGEFVSERASDDFYARFFDVRVPQPVDKKAAAGAAGAPETAKPSAAEPSAADLEAMAARVGGYTAPAAPAADSGLSFGA